MKPHHLGRSTYPRHQLIGLVPLLQGLLHEPYNHTHFVPTPLLPRPWPLETTTVFCISIIL